ncbi:6001_t:CDS:1 [Paraglomus occultum]|uniref:6001_t:CDS:1 n=1 Tax=Paraglomus occultum TaxID=144539 RepID=A0A9N8W0A1_9GLOM|nr:6001_t:CDS:1 [Paraglomus occultum]
MAAPTAGGGDPNGGAPAPSPPAPNPAPTPPAPNPAPTPPDPNASPTPPNPNASPTPPNPNAPNPAPTPPDPNAPNLAPTPPDPNAPNPAPTPPAPNPAPTLPAPNPAPIPPDPNAIPTSTADPNAIPTSTTDPNGQPLSTDSLSTDSLFTLTSSTASVGPTSTQTSISPNKSKGSPGLIAAIVGVAVAAAIVILVLGIWFCRRRKYKTYGRPTTRSETKDAQIGYILRGEGNVNPFTPNDSVISPIGGITRGEDQRSSISTNNAGYSVADSIAEDPATSTDSRRASIVVPTPITRVDIRKLDAALNTVQGRDPFGDPSTEGSTSIRSSPANSIGNYGAYSTHSRMQSTSTPPLNQGGLGESTTAPPSLNNNATTFRPMETAHIQDFGSVGSRSSLQSTGNYGGTNGHSRTLRQQQLGQHGGSLDLGHRVNDSVSSTSGQSADDRVRELLLQRGTL